MASRKGRRGTWLVAAGVAVGVLVAAGTGPVIGQDAQLVKLRATCEGPRAIESKLTALKALADLDTRASREVLRRYAAGRDEKLAVHALLTMGRADSAGVRSELQTTFEDTDRPHAVRVAAFLAWARLAVKYDMSWSTIETYAKQHCAAGSPLEASVLAAKNLLAPATKGGK